MGLRVESAIDHVTVFPGAARVTRVARAAIAGRTELELAGLPLALDEESLQVSLDGPARAADLRVTIEVAGREAVPVGDDELVALRRTAATAQAVRDHLRRELAELGALAVTARGDREEPAPAWADALAARLALVDARTAREAIVREELAAADKAVTAAERALAAARDRKARASTARVEAGTLRKTVVVTVEPEGAGGDVAITLAYLVSGARWAPSYAARLDGAGGLRFELRASVAQATGEDWSQVKLEVSTAAPGRWLDLPELPARRIGRRQAAPARPGWRPPPVGAEAMFADFDRGFPRPPAAPEPVRPPVTTTVAAPPPPVHRTQAFAMDGAMPLDEGNAAPARGRADGKAKRGAAPADVPMMKARMATPPAPMMAQAAAPMMAPGAAPPMGGMGGGGPPQPNRQEVATVEEEEAAAELVVGAQLLVYARLRMAGPHERRRGHLVPMSRTETWGVAAEVADVAGGARAASLPPPPPGPSEVRRGVYDHAFTSDGRVDLPSDGSWHNLGILARDARVTLGHVVVPSVALDVYRQATLTNPLDAPLLAGPVDVYDRGELVTTTTVDTTAPGATVELGLGVDATVKVARNARFREEVAGMLRGALKLLHEVTIDVENLGPRPIQLEVRERIPIPAAGTDDVEVELDRVQPAWEAWRPEPGAGEQPLRGGHRWRLDVAARAKATLRVDYHVRISQKHELVGGNRREP